MGTLGVFTITGRTPTRMQLLNIPTLAESVLGLTTPPQLRARWRRERIGAIQILRAARRAAYFDTEDARWDFDWLTGTLHDVAADVAEIDPPEEDDRGISVRDFVACGTCR